MGGPGRTGRTGLGAGRGGKPGHVKPGGKKGEGAVPPELRPQNHATTGHTRDVYHPGRRWGGGVKTAGHGGPTRRNGLHGKLTDLKFKPTEGDRPASPAADTGPASGVVAFHGRDKGVIGRAWEWLISQFDPRYAPIHRGVLPEGSTRETEGRERRDEFDEATYPGEPVTGLTAFKAAAVRVYDYAAERVQTARDVADLKVRTARADLADVGAVVEMGRAAMGGRPPWSWTRDSVRTEVLRKMGLTEADVVTYEMGKEVDRAVDVILTENVSHSLIDDAILCHQRIGEADRRQMKMGIFFRMKEMGLDRLSSDPAKAVDSMIDLLITAQESGIVEVKGGMSVEQLSRVLTTLYVNDGQTVRIEKAELTHVPMVVRNMMGFFRESFVREHKREPNASEKKVAFLTALLHDAGKFDANLRTIHGFRVLKNSFLNSTGVNIEVRPNESLEEAVGRLSQDDAFLASVMEAKGLKTIEEARGLVQNLPLLKGPRFLVGVVAHQDSVNVSRTIEGMVEQGILTLEEAAEVKQGVELHALVSTWILDNSFGGIGIQSNTVIDPKRQNFVSLYRAVHLEMQQGVTPEALADPRNPAGQKMVTIEINGKPREMTYAQATKRLRAEFEKFPPVAKGIMLADHSGQADVAKYMMILGGSPANAKASVHDVLFGRENATGQDLMTNSVVGVLGTHSVEQRALAPELGEMSRGQFEDAERWLRKDLGALLVTATAATAGNPVLSEAYSKHLQDHPESSVIEWLKSVPVKIDGKENPVFTEIRNEVEREFYEYSTVDSTTNRRFRLGT